jgi:hypothetical protein
VNYGDIDSHTLALALEGNRQNQAELREAATAMEVTLFARMNDAGGTAIPDDDFKISLKAGTPTYELLDLIPLLELLPDSDLAKAYTKKKWVVPEAPAPYWKPAAWHGGRLNDIQKAYGDESDVGRRIIAARIPGARKLIVERKGGK